MTMERLAEQLGEKHTKEELTQLVSYLLVDHIEINRENMGNLMELLGPEQQEEFLHGVKGFAADHGLDG